MDDFGLQSPDESRPIIEKLSYIVDQVTSEDHDTDAKLMECSESKFQGKVNEKIYGDISLSKVELAKKVEKVKIVLRNIFFVYNKLCDFSSFTQDVSQRILSLERNLKISSTQLPTNLAQSEKYFSQSLHTQREIAILTTEETTKKAKLMQIQSSITLHLEVLHKEQMYVETILKKDSNLSTSDGLVHLATQIVIQYK